MPTTTKSARIHPSWEVRIEKLLHHQNLEERDKSEFIAAALVDHVTIWLLKQPQFPPALLESIYEVISLAGAERDRRRRADISHAFGRLQHLVDRLQGDDGLITTLLTTMKALIDAIPSEEPLDKLFQNTFGNYPIDEALYNSLSGVSLKPTDAVEEAEPKPKKKTDSINPDDFDQPVQDNHGHTTTVGGRIPELLDSTIDKIIECRAFPYDTGSDLLRHAIARRIVALETQPAPRSTESQAAAIARVLRDWEVRLDGEASFFAILRETVEDYTKLGDVEAVYAACIAAKVRIEIMPDSLWKERKRRLFEAEFGHLLAGRGIDLNPNHS